jgi:leader peptidase (prepilin peptidase)/N-methyltransferase
VPDLALALLAVGGLCIGSFLNVAICRLPHGGSLVRPPSQCPLCSTPLRRRDLIPVVSWIALHGRCHTCRAPISARYPLVELTTAVLFVAIGARFGTSWALPAYLAFAAGAVALSCIDLDTFTLPRRIVYFGGLAGGTLLTLASVAVGEPSRILDAGVGALGAASFLLVLHLIAPRGMGFGDVRFAGVIGLHLGWLGLLEVPTGLFVAFALGAVVGIGCLLVGGASWRTRVPFGPFLAAGALVTVLWGHALSDVWLPT